MVAAHPLVAAALGFVATIGAGRPVDDASPIWSQPIETPSKPTVEGVTNGGAFNWGERRVKTCATSMIRPYRGRLPDIEPLASTAPALEFSKPPAEEMCKRWFVFTPRVEPIDKIRHLTGTGSWCGVLVGDETGPASTEYETAKVKFLTLAEQGELPYRIARLSPRIAFDRRNLGYMYAIHRGAEVIFDMDTKRGFTDFHAELPLYQRSDALEEYLLQHGRSVEQEACSRASHNSQASRAEAFAIILYEDGMIGDDELSRDQAWLQDLRDTGYGEEEEVKRQDKVQEVSTRRRQAAGLEGIQTVRRLGTLVAQGQPYAGAPSLDSHWTPRTVPNVLLVIAVVSARSERREAIRVSWAKWGDQRVELRFFTEAPSGSGPHAEATAAALEEEAAAHGDLVFMDIDPGMNFAPKLLWAMRWMSDRCTFDFFLRLDDDYFLCLDRLLNELDATLAGAQQPLNVYAGHRYCSEWGRVRIDEAYLLLSATLVSRVLSAPNLVCTGHAGVTAGWWFTKGNTLNRQTDVEWVHDPRLDHAGDLFLPHSPHRFKDVCVTHMGVHHAYPSELGELWQVAKKQPGPGPDFDGSLLRYVDDGSCNLVDVGVARQYLDLDNPQPCNAFVTKDVAIHCGAQGC